MTKTKKTGKQRKKYFQSKLHETHKYLASHLSKSLKKELNLRSLTVRKGDVVKVMRGELKDKKGKITKVDYKKKQVFIKELNRKKTDGKEIPIAFNASNLMIIDADRSDRKRLKRIKKGKTQVE